MILSLDGRFWGSGSFHRRPGYCRSSRPTALVRVTHWNHDATFFALLLIGIETVISHPRFYGDEVGNGLNQPLFELPIKPRVWPY